MKRSVFGAIVLAGAVSICVTQRASAYVYGIDVYAGNGVMNWTLIAGGGKDFAMAKATEGEYYKDAQLSNNESGGSANGLLMSCYDFAEPTEYSPVSEADYYYNYANQYGSFGTGKMIPMLDLETGLGATSTTKNCIGGPNDTGDIDLAKWAVEWATEVKAKTGQTPMIYVNQNYAENLDASTGIASYPLFLAAYDHVTPNTGVWSSYTFLQYSDGDRVAGDPGAVDADVYNGSLSSLISKYAIGGTAPAVTVTTPEPGSLAVLSPLLMAFARRRKIS